jgi:hypothetical protein
MNVFETQVDLSPSGRMTAPRFLLEPLALETTAIAPTENACPVCVAHMVTFTRAVPIFSYVPCAATTLSPEMAGTVKLCAPELVPAGELAGGGVLFGYAEFFVFAEALVEGAAVAEFVPVDEAVGAPDAPDAADEAVGEPPEAAPVAAAEGLDPLVPHAVRPAPPMTAAMITAGTRHILILLPFAE